MRVTPLILPVINCALWCAFALFELGGLRGIGYVLKIGSQHFDWFTIIPLIVLTGAVLPALILSQTKWAYIGTILSLFTLVAVLPYGCLSGGGI